MSFPNEDFHFFHFLISTLPWYSHHGADDSHTPHPLKESNAFFKWFAFQHAPPILLITLPLLLLHRPPESLHRPPQPSLPVQRHLVQPQKRDQSQSRHHRPRGTHQPLRNLRNVIGRDVVQPYPTVRRDRAPHHDSQRLVHHPVRVGVGREAVEGKGRGQEGRHVMVEVRRLSAGVSGQGGRLLFGGGRGVGEGAPGGEGEIVGRSPEGGASHRSEHGRGVDGGVGTNADEEDKGILSTIPAAEMAMYGWRRRWRMEEMKRKTEFFWRLLAPATNNNWRR
mmetsp:Transcript_57541/g.122091  ORF Transcript_57541/g.122091 Transcript_57541/m.122091 type:complete len:280 (-) Transcript_57541:24-863(-)